MMCFDWVVSPDVTYFFHNNRHNTTQIKIIKSAQHLLGLNFVLILEA
jgi:hypothetical protein